MSDMSPEHAIFRSIAMVLSLLLDREEQSRTFPAWVMHALFPTRSARHPNSIHRSRSLLHIAIMQSVFIFSLQNERCKHQATFTAGNLDGREKGENLRR